MAGPFGGQVLELKSQRWWYTVSRNMPNRLPASLLLSHRTHLMNKLGLHGTADLLRYAARHGLI